MRAVCRAVPLGRDQNSEVPRALTEQGREPRLTTYARDSRYFVDPHDGHVAFADTRRFWSSYFSTLARSSPPEGGGEGAGLLECS